MLGLTLEPLMKQYDDRYAGGPINARRVFEAELATEDNLNTWRQWVWQWDAEPGTHTLDGRQALQYVRVRKSIGDGSDLQRIGRQQAFLSSVMQIEPQWIDYNGHLNMAYYNVLFDRAVDEVFELLDLDELYRLQWGARGSGEQYENTVKTEFEPTLARLKKESVDEGWIKPEAIYGYFPAQSQGNDVIIYDPAMFNADEAAAYMSSYSLMEDRHFFVATLALNPS